MVILNAPDLDFVESLELGGRNKDNDGLLAALDLDFASSSNLKGTQLAPANTTHQPCPSHLVLLLLFFTDFKSLTLFSKSTRAWPTVSSISVGGICSAPKNLGQPQSVLIVGACWTDSRASAVL